MFVAIITINTLGFLVKGWLSAVISIYDMSSFNCSTISQARRALRALRGLVRLKSIIQGQSVKRQATTTLRCMQTLARMQSQIRARRIRMLEENQALQRQIQNKHEKEIEKFRVSVSSSTPFFFITFHVYFFFRLVYE